MGQAFQKSSVKEDANAPQVVIKVAPSVENAQEATEAENASTPKVLATSTSPNSGERTNAPVVDFFDPRSPTLGISRTPIQVGPSPAVSGQLIIILTVRDPQAHCVFSFPAQLNTGVHTVRVETRDRSNLVSRSWLISNKSSDHGYLASLA